MVISEGEHWLVETKGREHIDVANKDRAAKLWVENATRLTGTAWDYIEVPQKEYEKLQADEFADLAVFVRQNLFVDILTLEIRIPSIFVSSQGDGFSI